MNEPFSEVTRIRVTPSHAARLLVELNERRQTTFNTADVTSITACHRQPPVTWCTRPSKGAS